MAAPSTCRPHPTPATIAKADVWVAPARVRLFVQARMRWILRYLSVGTPQVMAARVQSICLKAHSIWVSLSRRDVVSDHKAHSRTVAQCNTTSLPWQTGNALQWFKGRKMPN